MEAMKYYYRTNRIPVLCIALFTFANFINSCWFHITYIYLSENQILYIYSSLAQIVGALLGITIAGYGLIDSKNKEKSDSDSALTIDTLRAEQFTALLAIIVISILIISVCLIVLSIYDNSISGMLPFCMTEAIIIFCFLIVGIWQFTHYLSPDATEAIARRTKALLDGKNAELSGDFPTFLATYNQLEDDSINFAYDLTQSRGRQVMKFTDALYVFKKYEVISSKGAAVMNSIRQYRNTLVHSTDEDKSVNATINKQLEDVQRIIHDLRSLYNSKNGKNEPSNEYNNKKKELYDLFADVELTVFEKNIINYLSEHPNAYSIELANEFNCSNKLIISKLLYLLEIEKVTREGFGKETRWSA